MWSFGVVCYEVMAQLPPWHNVTPAEAAVRTLKGFFVGFCLNSSDCNNCKYRRAVDDAAMHARLPEGARARQVLADVASESRIDGTRSPNARRCSNNLCLFVCVVLF